VAEAGPLSTNSLPVPGSPPGLLFLPHPTRVATISSAAARVMDRIIALLSHKTDQTGSRWEGGGNIRAKRKLLENVEESHLFPGQGADRDMIMRKGFLSASPTGSQFPGRGRPASILLFGWVGSSS